MARARAVARAACTLLLVSSAVSPVRAQHASDNPVVSAEDAFGFTLGLESIGMYSPGQVRGFSPQTAGNVRIDGLYFDQQGALSNRVIEGSTVRVGISEIGYAFPAPTGIVDYNLRHPGDGTPSALVIANAGPYEAWGVSIDGSVPLIGKQLLLPIGVSTQVSTQTPAILTLATAPTVGAQDSSYTATLTRPVSAPREVVALGNIWRCKDDTCRLVSKPTGADSVSSCSALRHQVGALTFYGTSNRPI